MRKKLFGRLLSVVLSATLAISPSLTAFAEEGPEEPIVVDTEQDEEADTQTPEQGEPSGDVVVEADDDVLIIDEDGAEEAEEASEELDERLGAETPTSYTVKITYYAENGTTLNNQVTSSYQNKEVTVSATTGIISEELAPLVDRSDNPYTGYPEIYDDYYIPTWEIQGGSNVLEVNGSNYLVNKIDTSSNPVKLTANTEIKLVAKYTPKKYTVKYGFGAVGLTLTEAQEKAIEQALESTANYPDAYEFLKDGKPFLLKTMPYAIDGTVVTWHKGIYTPAAGATPESVAKDGTASAHAYNSTEFYDAAGTSYEVYPDAALADKAVIAFYAEYTPVSYVADFADQSTYGWTAVTPGFISGTIDLAGVTPARQGYVFKGWFLDAACSADKEIKEDTNGDIKYTAKATDPKTIKIYTKWQAEEVDLAIDYLDTSGVYDTYTVTKLTNAPTKIAYDGTITLTAPSIAGSKWAFAGWEVAKVASPSTNSDYTALTANSATNPTAWSFTLDDSTYGYVHTNIKIRAKWKLVEREITVELNHASYTDYDYSGSAPIDVTPEYTPENAAAISASADVTLTPILPDSSTGEKKTYTLDPATKYIYLGVPTLANDAGYTFSKWMVKSGSSAAEEVPGVQFTVSTVDYVADNAFVYEIKNTDTAGLIFTAVFTETTEVGGKWLTNPYELDGGVNNPRNPDKFYLGSAASGMTIKLYAPTKADANGKRYTFDGWYTAANYNTASKLTLNGDVYEFAIANQIDDWTDAQSVKFYAKWIESDAPDTTPNKNVSINSDGGTIDGTNNYVDIAASSFRVGTKLDNLYLPEKLYKSGNHFDGWYLLNDKGEFTTKVEAGYVITDVTNIKAKFTPITYTVTFNAKGQTATFEFTGEDSDHAATTAFELRKHFKSSVIDNATAYKFVGWNADIADLSFRTAFTVSASDIEVIGLSKDGFITAYETAMGGVVKATTSPTVAVSLYADFGVTANEFKVILDATPEDASFVFDDYDFIDSAYVKSGDTAAALRAPLTVKEGQDLVLSGKEYVRKGYTLSSWKGSDGKSYQTAGNITISAAPDTAVTLRAVWTKDKDYTIKLNLNGGKFASGVKAPVKYTYDGAAVEVPKPSKVGYTFTGWNTRVDGSGDDYTAALTLGRYQEIEEGNVVLFAQYSQNATTITFDTNGGTYIAPQTVAYGDKLSLKNYTTTRPGYKFSTWVTILENGKEKKFGAKADVKNISVNNANFTFKAVWTPIKYSITYDIGKGAKQAKSDKSFTPETAATTVIATPTRDGYTFLGWDTPTPKKKGDYIWVNPVKNDASDITKGYKLTAGNYGNVVLKALWQPRSIEVEYRNGAAVLDTKTYLYSETDINMTAIAAKDTSTGKSIAGFALESGATKAKYLVNKAYKMEDIAKAAGISDKPTTNKIILYAVEEDEKYFIETTVLVDLDGDNAYTSDGETTVTTYNYKPTSGFSVPTPKKTGFTFEKWTGMAGTVDKDYSVDKKTGALKILKTVTSTANKMKVTTTLKATEYTVVINPNAKDATGTPANIKVKFNDTLSANMSISASDYPNLKRTGYTLAGFSTKKGAKAKDVYGTSLDLFGLVAKGATPTVTVYAIWDLNAVPYRLGTSAIDKDGNNLIYADAESAIVKIKGIVFSKDLSSNTTYYYVRNPYNKAYTLPKLSVKGYKFLGWKQTGTADADVVLDKKTGYAKSVAKTNLNVLTFTPVFEELTYKLSVNPNGGAYKGNKKVQVLNAKVKYSEDISKYIAEVQSSNMVKAGVSVNAVAFKKNPSKLEDYVTKSQLFSTKAVTLYPIWETTTATTLPGITAKYDRTNGKLVSVVASNLEADEEYLVQISSDKDFKIGVKEKTIGSADRDTNSNKKTIADVSVNPADAYYLRICKVTDNVNGQWVTITAVEAATTKTIEVVYFKDKSTEQSPYTYEYFTSVYVDAVVGETINSVAIPENAGIVGDGKWYEAKTTSAGKTYYELVDATAKVTSSTTKLFTKWSSDVAVVNKIFFLSGTTTAEVKSIAPITFEVNDTTWAEVKFSVPAVKEAYGFTGWYNGDTQITDAKGTVVTAVQSSKVSTAGDVNLTAHWSPIKYNIKFINVVKTKDADGNVKETEVVAGNALNNIEYGKSITLPVCTATPEAGYVFDKWQIGNSFYNVGTNDGNLTEKDEETLTAYATWRKSADATVYVDYIYDSGSVVDSYEAVYGSEGTAFATLAAAQFDGDRVNGSYSVINGYYYAEIYDNAGTVEMRSVASPKFYVRSYSSISNSLLYRDMYYREITTETMADLAEEEIFVPIMPITYKVAYAKADAGDAGTAIPDTAALSYTSRTDTAATPTDWAKTGQKFTGWMTDGGTLVAAGASLARLLPERNSDGTYAATVTLTAQWTPIKYEVKYLGNGAVFSNAIPNDKITYGDGTKAADGSTKLTKAGYKFLGWNTNASEAAAGTATITKDTNISTLATAVDGGTVRLYAAWEVIAVTGVTADVSTVTFAATDANTKTYDVIVTVAPANAYNVTLAAPVISNDLDGVISVSGAQAVANHPEQKKYTISIAARPGTAKTGTITFKADSDPTRKVDVNVTVNPLS